MKRILLATLGVLLLIPVTGCVQASTTTPPAALAPGYLNAADQNMGTALAGANDFYHTIQCETQGQNYNRQTRACIADPTITAPLVLSPTVKQAFNVFGTSLNTANKVYQSFHLGTATQAEAQAAVNTATSQQSALPLPGAKP